MKWSAMVASVSRFAIAMIRVMTSVTATIPTAVVVVSCRILALLK